MSEANLPAGRIRERRRARFGWAALLALAACEASPQFPAEVDQKGSVSLTGESVVVVDSYLAVSVRGAPLAPQIEYSISGTLTASTATIANEQAKKVDVAVTRSDDGRSVTLTLAPPPETTLSGSIELVVPSRIDLTVGSEGAIRAEAMEARTEITGYDQLELVDNAGNATAKTSNGRVVISSLLSPSTSVAAEVGTGNIVLALPSNVSANVEAAASGGVVIDHPAFPTPFGPARTQYSAIVNGGLGSARLLAQAGTITLSVRR